MAKRTASKGRKTSPPPKRSRSTPKAAGEKKNHPATVQQQSTKVPLDTIRRVDDLLSGRHIEGTSTAVKGFGYWSAIIILQVICFLWVRWCCTLYKEFAEKAL